MFKLNQAVTTPKGPATFIGYFGDGTRVQVSRMVPARELSQETREHLSPAILKLDREGLAAWLKSAKYCINEIIPLEDVTEAS